MLADIWKLIMGFGKAGLFGYGGGAGIIGMLRSEAVHSYGWLTEQEFTDMISVSYSLPGPLATQLAATIGWRVAGFWGALAALIAVLAPSLLLMFTVITFFRSNSDNPIVKGIMNGIRPVVFAILALLALEFFGFASTGWLTALIAGAAIILLYYFKLNPAILIVCAMIIGGIFLKE